LPARFPRVAKGFPARHFGLSRLGCSWSAERLARREKKDAEKAGYTASKRQGHYRGQNARAPMKKSGVVVMGEGVLLIAVTGYVNEEDRQRSQSAGFDHHLGKPADPGKLLGLLRWAS
jgi:hypothetical protein